jgi:hypothetical protein
MRPRRASHSGRCNRRSRHRDNSNSRGTNNTGPRCNGRRGPYLARENLTRRTNLGRVRWRPLRRAAGRDSCHQVLRHRIPRHLALCRPARRGLVPDRQVLSRPVLRPLTHSRPGRMRRRGWRRLDHRKRRRFQLRLSRRPLQGSLGRRPPRRPLQGPLGRRRPRRPLARTPGQTCPPRVRVGDGGHATLFQAARRMTTSSRNRTGRRLPRPPRRFPRRVCSRAPRSRTPSNRLDPSSGWSIDHATNAVLAGIGGQR